VTNGEGREHSSRRRTEKRRWSGRVTGEGTRESVLVQIEAVRVSRAASSRIGKMVRLGLAPGRARE